ncbi:unnamed protein product, partial [Polarella glacialis]
YGQGGKDHGSGKGGKGGGGKGGAIGGCAGGPGGAQSYGGGGGGSYSQGSSSRGSFGSAPPPGPSSSSGGASARGASDRGAGGAGGSSYSSGDRGSYSGSGGGGGYPPSARSGGDRGGYPSERGSDRDRPPASSRDNNRDRPTHGASARVSSRDRDGGAFRRPSGDRALPSDRGGGREGGGSRTLPPRSSGPPNGPPSDRGGDRYAASDRGRVGGSYPPPSDRDRPSGSGPPPAAPSSRGGGIPPPSTLTTPPARPALHVSGCSNDTVSNIIQGVYTTKEENHGKPVYKKEGVPGSVTVLIYYWDDRDGAAFNGWWFGPKVGGDQVWAYNGGNLGRDNVMPPNSNWKVPWDGKVDDKLRISPTTAKPPPVSSARPGAGPAGLPGGPSGPVAAAQRATQRNAEEAAQRQAEEERRRRDAERERQRVAEEKARQQREERAREEERQKREREARREAELRRQREQEEIAKKQEAAANVVRKAITKLRSATPETFQQLKAELDKVCAQNFQAMGESRVRVNDELQLCVIQVQKRITDEIKEREEQERRKREEMQRVEQLVKVVAVDVQLTEDKVAEAQAAAKATIEQGTSPEASPKAILEAVESSYKVAFQAKDQLERTNKLLAAKETEMGNGEGARHVKREVEELRSRLHGSQRALTRSSENLEETRGRGQRRATSLKQEQDFQEGFTRHDADGDGRLDRGEVTSFSKAEFDYDLPEAVLNRIMRVLEPIGFDKFVPLRQKVAIAKSEAEARARRAHEEERKRAAEEKRQEVQQIVDDVTKALGSAEAKLVAADDALRALAKDSGLSSDAVAQGTTEAEGRANEADEELGEAKAQSLKAEKACGDIPELRRLATRDVPWLQGEHKRAEALSEKCRGLIKVARDKAAQKASEEVDKLKAQAVAAVRAAMSAQGKSGEETFEEINGGSALSCESFVAYLKGLGGLEEALSPDSALAGRLFAHVAGSEGEEGEIAKESFLELIKLFYKCVKGTVLSDDITIKSKTVRRLEVGEVLEALEGPSKDEGANVQRVRCLAVQ